MLYVICSEDAEGNTVRGKPFEATDEQVLTMVSRLNTWANEPKYWYEPAPSYSYSTKGADQLKGEK